VIESIGIRNLGVIESAQLELGNGFIALTGETGAGKTMVLNALNLLLGGRADSGMVRSGESQLFVEGIWLVEDSALAAEIEQTGAQLDDGRLFVNRGVSSDGRSRAALGGAQVPVGTLAQIAGRLVTVHGQSDQTRLRSSSAQRDALDDYGAEAVLSAKAAYQSAFIAYKELAARLARLEQSSAQDLARVQSLRELLSSLEKLAPEADELVQIEERINRLANVEQLRHSANLAHEVLAGEEEPTGLQLLARAVKVLDQVSDPVLQELATRLGELASLASDASAELASFLVDLEADPAQLEALQLRKSELIAMERKVGLSLNEILTQIPAWQSELIDLDSSDEQVEKLQMQFSALESQLAHAARELTRARNSAARNLEHQVGNELSQLAMGSAKFTVAISELSDFESSGLDRVEFLLANAGTEARPIAKSASGGELSRIMLAIELVIVANRDLPTMIFDEVDAGVGGQAAVELGRRLRKLSEKTQVIVVTHLPQVAAFANRQIRVSKSVNGDVTSSSIAILELEERTRELARMLSGNPDSDVALQHARELLNID
jgi:DNA repair protein RecN (Recombination protein N)